MFLYILLIYECFMSLVTIGELLKLSLDELRNRCGVVGSNYVSESGTTCFHWMCLREMSLDQLKIILESGWNINHKNMLGTTPFHVVCNVGWFRDAEIIKLCLQFGADLNVLDCDNKTPFDMICDKQDSDMKAEILCHIAKMNLVDSSSALRQSKLGSIPPQCVRHFMESDFARP